LIERHRLTPVSVLVVGVIYSDLCFNSIRASSSHSHSRLNARLEMSFVLESFFSLDDERASS